MSHKLGITKRIIKTKFISIHEPTSSFYYYYPLDDNGNLIRKEDTGFPMYFTKSKIDIEQNNSISSDVLVQPPENISQKSPNMTNSEYSEINSNGIININNLLNKHPFPSLTTYDPNGNFLQQKNYQQIGQIYV